MTTLASRRSSHHRHRGHGAARLSADALEQLLGRGVELLVAAVIVLSPLAFGSVEHRAQWWMMLGLGVAGVLLLVRWLAFPKTLNAKFTFAFVPIALFLLFALLQWVALPSPVVSLLSPKTAAVWHGVNQLLPGETVHQTLSLYPRATERQLRLLLLASGMFACVFVHFREREQIIRLLWAVVMSGVCVGMIAALQNVSDGPSTWWGVPMAHPDSGPFMNHSAFGQFMNLCSGAALALLLIGLKRQIGDREISYRSLRHHLFRKSSLSLLLPFIFVLIAPVLVALSLTRGGVLSIAIAGGITGVLLGFTQSGRGRRTVLAVIGLLILLVLLKFGFDRVYERMATLRDVHETGGGVRLQMLRDMWPIFKEFPIVGVGLGAFSHVFPSYDSAAIASFATHAENDYAQLAVETGVAGITLAGAFLVVVLYNASSAIHVGRRSIHAGAVGLMYGFVAILIHSASDFGQHVPAVANVTAVITALLIRLGIDARASRAPAGSPIESATSRLPRWLTIVVTAAMLGGWTWMMDRTSAESNAEIAWMSARRDYLELQRRGVADVSDEEFIRTLQAMTKSVGLVPDDAEYRFGLSVMRWQSIERYDRRITTDFLRRIGDECMSVSAVAPYFGPAITFAGQVRYFDLNDKAGIPLIRRGYALARYSREASFAVAMLDAAEGDWDACMTHFRHAVDLGASRADAAQMLATRYRRTDLALELVKGSRVDMAALAQTLERIGQKEAARELNDSVSELLIAEASQPDAPADALVQLASAYLREGQYADAVPLLRRALIGRFDRSEWRVLLIQSLVAVGNVEDAEREARTNYRLNPGNAQAKQLLEDILVAPTTQLTRPK